MKYIAAPGSTVDGAEGPFVGNDTAIRFSLQVRYLGRRRWEATTINNRGYRSSSITFEVPADFQIGAMFTFADVVVIEGV